MKDQLELFNGANFTTQTPSASPQFVGKRKILSPNRTQVEFRIETLEAALPHNHKARDIYNFVTSLDLTDAYKAICSLEGCSGRPAVDPAILISLWIYAISENVVSARKIAEYCKDHRGYAWICGGVSVGHHLLSKFRSDFCEVFEDLVVQSISALVWKGVVEMKQVSQDGVKIQASASKKSFHRKNTLKETHQQICQHIEKLEELKRNGILDRTAKKEKEREAHEASKKERRLQEALREMENFRGKKKELKEKHRKKLSKEEIEGLKVSVTDPESRIMKMADGGFKPAYNVQIAVDVATELALGVRVSQNGTDGGEMLKMYQILKNNYCKPIRDYLVDTGFKNKQDLDELYQQGISVYMPTTNGKAQALKDKVLNTGSPDASKAEIDWIVRMEKDESKKIYTKRIRSSETINAYFRNHGLGRLAVRGMHKVGGLINLFCLAYNLNVMDRLGLV